MYLVMFLVACVDETRKKNYYRHELCSFSRRNTHLSRQRHPTFSYVKRALSSPTSSPGRFSLALEVGREKALASAGESVILIG